MPIHSAFKIGHACVMYLISVSNTSGHYDCNGNGHVIQMDPTKCNLTTSTETISKDTFSFLEDFRLEE